MYCSKSECERFIRVSKQEKTDFVVFECLGRSGRGKTEGVWGSEDALNGSKLSVLCREGGGGSEGAGGMGVEA